MGIFTEKVYVSYMTTVSTIHMAGSLENTTEVRKSWKYTIITFKLQWNQSFLSLLKYSNIKLKFNVTLK